MRLSGGLSFLFLFVAFLLQGQVIPLDSLICNADRSSDSAFLATFSYHTYIDQFGLDDLQQLELARQQVSDSALPGTDLAYELLISVVIDSHSITPTKIAEQVRLCETMLTYSILLDYSKSWCYEAAADHRLEALAQLLKQKLVKNTWNKHDFRVKYAVERLRENGYLVDVPTSKSEKFWYHFGQGNFGYLFSRYQAELKTNGIVQFGTVFPFLLLIGWGIFKQRKKSKQNKQ